MRFGTVILAAGASTRMGRPKLLLPWGERTILAHLVEQWKSLGTAQIGLVVREGSEVKAEVETHEAKGGGNIEHPRPIDVIINPQPDSGMFSSVQCAARWEGWGKDMTHFAISLGDQPHVRLETLRALIDFAQKHPGSVCQPARKGRGRHPVILPREMLLEAGRSMAKDLKEFLATKGRKLFESSDAGLDIDLDTPEDYLRAKAGLESGA